MKDFHPVPLALRMLLLVAVGLFLTSCIRPPLLSEVLAAPTTLFPTSEDHENDIEITYSVGCDAQVSIAIESSAGHRYALRHHEPRKPLPHPYTLRFDGTVPTSDPTMPRQLLPGGSYTVVVQARSASCGNAEARLPITIADHRVVMPAIEHLTVWPETISPNADAIDDVAEITYRLPVTATVDISITTPDQRTIPLVSRREEPPAEHHQVWNGKHPDGTPLSNGVYTCTISAEDAYGNLVRHQRLIRLTNVGTPEATITYARIAPQRLMLGEPLTITMRVKNTGSVPIRTYGPPGGFGYTTNEVFSSVEDGRYASHAGGFWRIGVDWDANSGDGPKRYPFRWALSQRPPEQWAIPGQEDWLLPGEEVEVTGYVTVLQRETKMGFYVGLIQDGVGFFQDRTARTIVEVGF